MSQTSVTYNHAFSYFIHQHQSFDMSQLCRSSHALSLRHTHSYTNLLRKSKRIFSIAYKSHDVTIKESIYNDYNWFDPFEFSFSVAMAESRMIPATSAIHYAMLLQTDIALNNLPSSPCRKMETSPSSATSGKNACYFELFHYYHLFVFNCLRHYNVDFIEFILSPRRTSMLQEFCNTFWLTRCHDFFISWPVYRFRFTSLSQTNYL